MFKTPNAISSDLKKFKRIEYMIVVSRENRKWKLPNRQ